MSTRSGVDTPPLTPDSLSRSNSTSPSPPATLRDLDVVIAHYNEDLTWLGAYAPLCTIYSKGQPAEQGEDMPPFRANPRLPNIGRESHTYLWHIVKNYDDLARVTLFLQGNIHDVNDGTPAHTDLTIAELVGQASRLEDLPGHKRHAEHRHAAIHPDAKGAIMPIGKINTFSDWDGIRYVNNWIERRGRTLVRTQLTPDDFWNYIFAPLPPVKADDRDEMACLDCNGEPAAWEEAPSEEQQEDGPNNSASLERTGHDHARSSLTPLRRAPHQAQAQTLTHPTTIRFIQGALFAVTAATIRRYPREFYARLLRYFEDMDETNPEEGHYMERFWLGIFEGPRHCSV